MHLFDINTDTCNRCGVCAATCPGALIRLPKGGYPRAIPGADKGCVRCGHCVVICPTGSLSHREIPVERCAPLQGELGITAGQCDYFLKSRRSIRVYEDKPVTQEVLIKVIDTARYAPSGHNDQPVEWLVVTSGEELLRIRSIAADWMRWMIADKPEIADMLSLRPMLKNHEAGNDPILRKAPALVIAHAKEDNPFAPAACLIALTYLELAAYGMGLGCCWAGLFNRAVNTYSPMLEALQLPRDHKVFGSMMVGYPRYRYQRLPTRKPAAITWRS